MFGINVWKQEVACVYEGKTNIIVSLRYAAHCTCTHTHTELSLLFIKQPTMLYHTVNPFDVTLNLSILYHIWSTVLSSIMWKKQLHVFLFYFFVSVQSMLCFSLVWAPTSWQVEQKSSVFSALKKVKYSTVLLLVCLYFTSVSSDRTGPWTFRCARWCYTTTVTMHAVNTS